ncbi:MAG TPA: hypothetical protein VLG76_01110 [Rhabdochlamydiaceae bacterium]|nr:hypothetical protein [Rhabdochlamydiaceae bacterium]
MIRKWLIFLLFFAGILSAADESQAEISEAEFEEVKGTFKPWYTGPLITGSSNVVPIGTYNTQPFLYLMDFYATFDEHGKSHSIPNWFQWRAIATFQFGITEWMNGLVIANFVNNSQKGHHAAAFGDTSFGLYIQLLKEDKYTPGVLFAVTESFPTGRYQRLNSKKWEIDATGSGSFQTVFTLNVGKVVWWWLLDHPMEFRMSLNYQIGSRAEVHGFNAYGGGFDTKGKVHPGDVFAADFGYQFSFTQRWVFALDVVYAFALKSTFSGRPGLATEGGIAEGDEPLIAIGAPFAAVGVPFNDNFSLLPALEYNWNENLGVIAGIWFSPWGRNSLQFVGGVATVTWTW